MLTKIMIITPAVEGGSWIALKQIIEGVFLYKQNVDILVINYGHRPNVDKGHVRSFHIPFFSYIIYGHMLLKFPILNILYCIPLLVFSIILGFIYRPNILITNGPISSLSSIILKPIIRCKTIVSYRGSIRRSIYTKLLRIVNRFVDVYIVNSTGSRDNCSIVADPNKIVISKHVADECFFTIDERERIRNELGLNRFVILFVGRVDEEKHIPVLLNTIKNLDPKEFMFIIIGDGNMSDEIRKYEKNLSNLKYIRYIGNREKLAKFYHAADICFTYADDTYIARPAVESLAAGTPILIIDKPAVLTKNTKIEHDLIPSSIGWIVGEHELCESLINIKQRLSDHVYRYAIRKECRKYAIENHMENEAIKIILKYLDK